jgi:anti-anti-sigma regulatory factor
MFRIENVSDREDVILRLSGRIDSEHLEELRRQIEHNRRRLVLDLAEVTLVNRDVVQFLGHCESKGIELRHCAPYIREWIQREKG